MREAQTSSSGCYLACYLRNLAPESTVGPVNSAAIQCVPAAVQPGSRAAEHRARLVPKGSYVVRAVVHGGRGVVVPPVTSSASMIDCCGDCGATCVTNRPALSCVHVSYLHWGTLALCQPEPVGASRCLVYSALSRSRALHKILASPGSVTVRGRFHSPAWLQILTLTIGLGVVRGLQGGSHSQ